MLRNAKPSDELADAVQGTDEVEGAAAMVDWQSQGLKVSPSLTCSTPR